jgi:polyhydroxyalkanoate synthesis regulator phasin
MAKSKAKKLREKLVREGRRNPEENRGLYVFADMRTRKTKTKVEKLHQEKHKKRLSDQYDSGSDGRFYIFVHFS